MNPATDPVLRDLFEAEADDELAGIERLLDRMGDPDAAAELYRHAHTIKGSAAVMGLEDVAALANVLESVFDRVRAGDGVVRPAGAMVIKAAVADLRFIVSGRLNHIDVTGSVRDTESALRALLEDIEDAPRGRSAAPEPSSSGVPACDIGAAVAGVDVPTELMRTVAAAQLAVMRLVAAASGVMLDDIPEYGRLEELFGEAVPVAGRASSSGKSALVVEDSPLVCEHHRRILVDAGFDVRTARDGAHALRLLGERPADVVITDVEMPELDGIDLTRAIRSSSQTSAIPVVVVTSRDDEHTRERSLAAGAHAFLVKTVNPGVLVSSVIRALEES